MNKIYGNIVGNNKPIPDWNQTDETKSDYIKNKPTLGALASKDTVEKSDLSAEVVEKLDKVVEVDLSGYSTTEEMNSAINDKAEETLQTVEDNYAKKDNVYNKTEVDTAMNGKSDSDHIHDDRYYTESETDSKFIKDLSINGKSITFTKGDNTSETITTQDTTYNVATSSVPGLVKSGTDITVDASGNVSVNDDSHNHIIGNIDGLQEALNGKETSGAAASALTSAQNYTNTKISELINSAPSTLDTLGEIAAVMTENADVVEALEDAIGLKADLSALNSHTGNTTIHITSDERTKWNNANTNATNALAEIAAIKNGSATIPSVNSAVSAQKDGKNQVIDATYIKGLSANGKTITFTKGDGTTGTLTTQDTTYTFNGAVSTIKDNNLTAGRALISDGGGKVAVSAVTSTELGYLDGVTSSVQTQLNGKAPTSHTHSKSQITDFPTSMPASDVYSWAKAASKPSYTWSEITGKPSTFTPADHTHITISGTYTGGGGAQPPSYVGSGTVRFNMMNQLKGLSSLGYTDFILMDTYTGSDVPYVTAIGVMKTNQPRAFIAVGAKGNTTTWIDQAELISSANISLQSVNYATSAGSANSVAWTNVSGRPSSMPASDVYSWAKAASKPSYAWSEITSKPSTFTPSAHNHAASEITSGTLAVARGGTGVTSNPSMLVNLGSTSAASVFAASPRPGVTGTLPVANGGTGATTAAAARTKLGFTLANLGVTATATELNYTDGVTSNIQTQLNARKITWDCPTRVGSYSRLCHFDKNYASYLLTVRFYQSSQALCNTYLITQAHSMAEIVHLGGNGYKQNADMQLRLVADSDNISVYVELLTNYSYDGSTTITAHCSCIPLSDIGTCTRYTTYTATTGGTVFEEISSRPSGINGALGTVIYQVNPETTAGLYCNGNTSYDSVNSITISDQWKRYKRLKIYARFPHGKCIQEFDLATPNQGSNATYGNSSGSIVSFNADNTSGVNNHYMVQINFCVREVSNAWIFQVIESGWIHMGLPPASTSHFTSNATTAIIGTSYTKWNQRHNSDYCIYKIVGYED